MRISLLTGSVDPHYQLDLVQGLVAAGVTVEMVGNDIMEQSPVINHPSITFYNLRGNQNTEAPIITKFFRVAKYYFKLIFYCTTTKSSTLHIQWPSKFVFFDRTLLNLYFKLLGKKLVFTAHNVNAGKRDGNDTTLNRISLKIMYMLMDHIIVHTSRSKQVLIEDFSIKSDKISVIEHGINRIIPQTDMTRAEARNKLELKDGDKVTLFFGNILPYKGLDYLLRATGPLLQKDSSHKIIIAGRNREAMNYWNETIVPIFDKFTMHDHVIQKTCFIPDNDIEIYFKAADVLVLPYTSIFQSGVLFVAYAFGLPVIATDVGSFRDDIIEGSTGYICLPENDASLSTTLNKFYKSTMFLKNRYTQCTIKEYAMAKYSWDTIGRKTRNIYEQIINKKVVK